MRYYYMLTYSIPNGTGRVFFDCRLPINSEERVRAVEQAFKDLDRGDPVYENMFITGFQLLGKSWWR